VNIPTYTFKDGQRNLLTAYHNLMTEIGFEERGLILWVKALERSIPDSTKISGT